MSSARTIRTLRRLWLAAVCALAASAAAFYLVPWDLSTRQVVVLTGVAAYAVTTLLLVFTRCPRCDRLFHNTLGFANPFSRRCAGCRTPLDEL